MNKLIKRFLLTFLTLVFVLPLMARTATDDYGSRNFDQQMLDMNQVNMYISNFGIFGQNNTTGNSGAFWPAGFPAETYIFGAGVWIGALVDTGFTVDSAGIDTTWLTDTLVSCGYNPNSGATEYVPGDIDDNSPDRPSPYTNPWDIIYISTSENSGQAWPLRNSEGGDSVVSMQDSYCEYNDKEASAHFTADNKPLGVEIAQTSYAWVGPLKEDMVFLKFDIRNDRTDSNDLKKCFVGVVADNDIGNEAGSAANDLLGFIDVDSVNYNGIDTIMQINVGYQFQTAEEAGWSHFPAIISYKYMESPIATEPVDLYHDSSYIIAKGGRIGMTTFNFFTIATDPATKQERYLSLAGYDHTVFNPNNPESSFRPFPTGEYWTTVAGYPGKREIDTRKGDKRFVMASGPFTLFNDSTATVIIAIIMSEDTSEMYDKILMSQTIYDAGWLGPVAPSQVNFDLVGLNKKVRIYWDNTQELTRDKYYDFVSSPLSPAYNPSYREFDVEGYNVYRSKTGAGGSWELLGKFDLVNEYTAIVVDSLIYKLNDQPNKYDTIYYYETLGVNSGVPYFFEDSNLVNGITYYYTVRAYDLNYIDYAVDAHGNPYGITPLILEGAGKTKAVIPRSPTSNYIASGYSLNYISGNVDTANLDMVVVPVLDTMVKEITSDTFTLHFGLIDSSIYEVTLPAYTYVITDKSGDTIAENKLALKNYTEIDPATKLPVVIYVGNAIEICNAYSGFVFKINNFVLDSTNWLMNGNSTADVKVVSGNYVDSILYPEYAAQGRQFFHGSKLYRLTWHEVVYPTQTVIGTDTFLPNDTNLTLTILDVDNNIEIPYNSRNIGDNWHFNWQTLSTASCPQYINSTSTATERIGIYFSNLKISFNKTGTPKPMVWANRPKDGDVWELALTPNDSTATFKYPPINSSFQFTLTPNSFSAVEDSLLNNVKVVPNPYVVRSELDMDYNYRRILFTNLPQVCTIRIYTLSGELIKTIEHNINFYVYSATGSDSTLVYDNTNGTAEWDVLTSNDQIPAAGIYIFHVQTPSGATKIGKFAVIK